MMKLESIQIFDSQGEAYKRAFQIFLDHTDQKRNAKRFLQKLVDGLPNRNVFIDPGAGNGEGTPGFGRRLLSYNRHRTESASAGATQTSHPASRSYRSADSCC